jgi:hypothetical protein
VHFSGTFDFNRDKKGELKPDRLIGMKKSLVPEDWRTVNAGDVFLPRDIHEIKVSSGGDDR